MSLELTKNLSNKYLFSWVESNTNTMVLKKKTWSSAFDSLAELDINLDFETESPKQRTASNNGWSFFKESILINSWKTKNIIKCANNWEVL